MPDPTSDDGQARRLDEEVGAHLFMGQRGALHRATPGMVEAWALLGMLGYLRARVVPLHPDLAGGWEVAGRLAAEHVHALGRRTGDETIKAAEQLEAEAGQDVLSEAERWLHDDPDDNSE